MKQIVEEINKAVKHAKSKHKIFPCSRAAQFAILVEEIGEIAETINDEQSDELYKREILDAAAVIVRMLEQLKGVEIWK